MGRCLQWLAVRIHSTQANEHDERVVTTSLTVTNSGRVGTTISLFFITWTGSPDLSTAGNNRSAWRNPPRSLLRPLSFIWVSMASKRGCYGAAR